MADAAPKAPAPAKEPIYSTVTLDEPVDGFGEHPITEVKVRKPDAGSLRGLKLVDVINVDVNAMFELLPRVTQPFIPRPILEKMNVSDFVALANEVALFLPQKGALTDSPQA